MLRRLSIILLLLPMLLASCGWQEAKDVIAVADHLDQTEHVIYDDTEVLGQTIRTLDNPVGRLLMSNTLGKAHYYMGRNLSLSNHIAEAAEHYIAADRLQIADPIYRGRVNSCMGYICAQNNSDSLALIFYERASDAFQESGNEWYYAQSLLNVSLRTIKVHQFNKADNVLQIAQTYSLDSAYQARYYEIKGLYFLEQQQYDSALVYFQEGLDYWQTKNDKCFSWLKILQIYYQINQIESAVPYAEWIVANSENPNYCSNAYYILIENAKANNNVELLATYSHQRADKNRLLAQQNECYSLAHQRLQIYLSNPHPWRWVWITLTIIVVICIILAIGAVVYRQRNRIACEQIVNLSVQLEKQANYLQKQERTSHYEKCLEKIRITYPAPLTKWNNYDQLKTDVAPYLCDWLQALDQLGLTNREKVFCVFTFVYPQLSAAGLATYLCNTEKTVRVLKTRLVKKLGIPSSQLHFFLQNLSNID